MDRMERSPLAVYLDHLEQGRLAYQRSAATGQAVFYPRVIAPGSGADDLAWHASAGLGTVYATTVVHPQDGAPYNVALIDMDEGFRLMSRVEDIAPDAVRIGLRVRFRVHQPAGGLAQGQAQGQAGAKAGDGEPPCPVFFPAEDVA